MKTLGCGQASQFFLYTPKLNCCSAIHNKLNAIWKASQEALNDVWATFKYIPLCASLAVFAAVNLTRYAVLGWIFHASVPVAGVAISVFFLILQGPATVQCFIHRRHNLSMCQKLEEILHPFTGEIETVDLEQCRQASIAIESLKPMSHSFFYAPPMTPEYHPDFYYIHLKINLKIYQQLSSANTDNQHDVTAIKKNVSEALFAVKNLREYYSRSHF